MKDLDPKRENKAAKMYRKGDSVTHIASKLRRPHGAVWLSLWKMRLPQKRALRELRNKK